MTNWIGFGIGRISAIFSIIGSSLIIYMILSDRKKKLARTYHRFMLSMSSFDVLQSIALCLSSAALPRESNVSGAIGNMFTCKTQGFFMVLGSAVPCYNSSLNIYYLLTIRHEISSERFKKIEPIFHVVSILVPLSTASILTTIEDIAPSMNVCTPSGDLTRTVVSCILGFCFLTCLISMICISYTVASRAVKMKKYTSFKNARRSRLDDDKKKTINQAFLYFAAFVVTYFPIILYASYRKGMEGTGMDPPYFTEILGAIFYPLQGFWNFFFYIRPGVQHVMKANSDKSYLGAIREVVFMNRVIKGRPKTQYVIPDKSDSSSVEILVEDDLSHTTDEPKAETERPRRLSLVDIGSMLNGEEDSVSTDSLVEGGLSHTTGESKAETERPRRLSLVHIGSMLNGEEDSVSIDSLVEDGLNLATCELKAETERPRRLSLVHIQC